MLDENLPSFHLRPSSDGPDSSVVYFTQNGSEPTAEYVLRRADPTSQPACRGKYAVALVDPFGPGVVYGEVLVAPEWQQPTLSAAEIRAQNGVAAPPVPLVPDSFSVQLYNPDQAINFKLIAGSWGKSDTWEFEMPTRSFRLPSASQLDRQHDTPPAGDIAPKVMFKWKRDGRLSKDMTCYMAGRSLGRHKSKEPDITVALFKQGRESVLTIYEPNLQRVDVEDRKGLDIVLLLGVEVIRDLYLNQRPDAFNIMTADPFKVRKGSCPTAAPQVTAAAAPALMSGALGVAADSSTSTAVDPEMRRLQAMVEREEREERDAEEQKRIKQMLQQEDARERQRRDAEIAMETELLRRMYGTEGQDLPSTRPHPPPRPQVPARPVSSGTSSANNAPGSSSWWWRGASDPVGATTTTHQQPQSLPAPETGHRLSGSYGRNPSASLSGFFSRDRDDDGRRSRKKRSVQF